MQAPAAGAAAVPPAPTPAASAAAAAAPAAPTPAPAPAAPDVKPPAAEASTVLGRCLGFGDYFILFPSGRTIQLFSLRSWTIGWNIEQDTCLMWILIDVVPKIERNWRFTSQDLCFWSTLGPDLGVQKLWEQKRLSMIFAHNILGIIGNYLCSHFLYKFTIY
jgi:hypothetical protein